MAMVMKKREPVETEVVENISLQAGNLRHVGGSRSDLWNNMLINQATQALWLKELDSKEHRQRRHAAIHGLMGINPADELEGMIAVQLIACHNASMECYRRAMISDQTFESRRENLSQATKLSRTYTTLVEALSRHRGKGQQKVTVEHVHVHQGGQAIVGNVEGAGMRIKSEDQPHALGYAPGQTLRSENPERTALPVARDGKR